MSKFIAYFLCVFSLYSYFNTDAFAQVEGEIRKKSRNKPRTSAPVRPNTTPKPPTKSPNTVVKPSTRLGPQIQTAANTGVVVGQLMDGESDEGLINATILVDGLKIGTLSDLEGNFELKNIPAGAQKIIVKYTGYLDKIIEVKIENQKTIDIGKINCESSAIGLEEVEIVSQIATDKVTPIALSTIDVQYRNERLGSQELPELLKLTPSVYSSKSGGGFGDSRINIRGFDQTNVAILINGVPVNDMESGRVFWSNWTGLGDALRSIQVQRGLGASKIAINSVGGTLNIITKTTDVEKGGWVSLENSNYYSFRLTVGLSTGRTAKGWAVSFVGSRTWGTGYIDKTDMSAWSYFLSISKEIGSRHILSFSVLGTPQEHNQRLTTSRIQTYQNLNNYRYNPDWGTLDGKAVATNVNFYHKPQVALNHYFNINDKLNLSSSIYFSSGRGGGGGIFTANRYRITVDNNLQIDLEKARNNNLSALDTINTSQNGTQIGHGSDMILANSVNSHNWFGVLSTLNYKVAPTIKILSGIDARYYEGYHYREVDNLLGGDFFVDRLNKNIPVRTVKVGDRFDYDYDSRVQWGGLFGQIEHTGEKVTAFVSGALSLTRYQRYDHYMLKGTGEESDFMNFVGYNVKAGINYKPIKPLNIFVNAGSFSRAPFFNFLFVDRKRSNDLSQNPTNERILSAEAGVGFRKGIVSVDANVYYTRWFNKGYNYTYTDQTTKATRAANITGLGAKHMGLEVEGTVKPLSFIQINVSGSLGDWRWANDVNAVLTNEINQEVSKVNLTIKDLYVGDAAQTTAGIGTRFQITKNFYTIVDFTYFARLFANYNPENRVVAANGIEDRAQPYQIPDYGLFDIHAGYDIKFLKYTATIRASVFNLFNKKYIIEGFDGKTHTSADLLCFYGFGRYFNLTAQFKF